MTEKEAIERSTAEGFLNLYNVEFRETYRIVEHSDAPDIRCKNDGDEILNLEITLTEDRTMDIAALLGRSDHRSIDSLRQSTEKENPERMCLQASSLSGNSSAMLVSRISDKFAKDYGKRVALVVRDTSPLDWPWDTVLKQVKAELDLTKSPFSLGIWLLNSRKDKVFRIT